MLNLIYVSQMATFWLHSASDVMGGAHSQLDDLLMSFDGECVACRVAGAVKS